jgi:predicted phage baseplate assembly protein
VAKGLTWKFRALAVPGVSLRNPSPAIGGADLEPLAEMELRARAQLNRPQRAVTLLDIERLALSTPHAHVARAYAIPNCPTPGRITVVVVPKIRPGRTGPPARPSDAFLAAVRRHLEERRLLCDNLRVLGPIYVEVRVAARLRLAKGAGAAAVIVRATNTLDRFFSGEDAASLDQPASADAAMSPCPTRWPFGRSVFPSDVYAVLDGVAGVDAASDVVLSARRNGVPIAADATGAIPVPRIGLVFAGPHDLVVDAEPPRRQ